MSPPAATETVIPTQGKADDWPKGILSQAMSEPSAAWTKVVPKPHLSGYPMLKPAFILKVNVETGRLVGGLSEGSNLIHWDTPTGTFESAEGYEHPVKAEVAYGSDWLTFDPDNKHARPHLKLLCKTSDGAILDMAYEGTAVVSQPVLDMFQRDPNARTIPFGISSTYHTFRTGDPRYKYLENHTFVGNGRFVVKQDPFSITVESRISQLVPSNDYD